VKKKAGLSGQTFDEFLSDPEMLGTCGHRILNN